MLLMQTHWEKHLPGPRLLAGNGHSKQRMNLATRRLEMTFFQNKEATNRSLIAVQSQTFNDMKFLHLTSIRVICWIITGMKTIITRNSDLLLDCSELDSKGTYMYRMSDCIVTEKVLCLKVCKCGTKPIRIPIKIYVLIHRSFSFSCLRIID